MVALSLSLLCLAAQGPILGVEGTQFTLDGKPAFLLGISYYGALGIEGEAVVADDLDRLRDTGFNWVRVWVTWDDFDNNVSAVAPDGSVRKPYMARLGRLCRLAGERGMVVDVTVTRGKPPVFPSSYEEHAAMMERLAHRLRPYRNVYFDIGNERNVGDARHVPMAEVGKLIALVKSIDPDRLCTASQGGDIGDDELRQYVEVGQVDFICPHRGRQKGTPRETAERTKRYLAVVNATRPVPVHYQEPFRRGYGDWQPLLEDFQTDLQQARAAGAAGWCFHNGSVRNGAADDGRPRRSFDLRPEEGRLFEQFDPVERAFVTWLAAQ